ncbi:6,7-dimethyl-8-ribityllumazine synthase [Hufsiella ginkgonis]|uniref:6,7-dimethyl-8-ribityllumazine synthase n=1 Tax=Hufsiella ginkgonis TaxID=2695274 RepID=A0A7K1Y4J5_9SPHI|nr:6,7-dimethyl-8-ribityllumazine synthase [Hufsiella ginkgonis]MXV17989.1 6,7-dimethyl-8-ribityllumazine synthase [Hufsiella ginkgonis]
MATKNLSGFSTASLPPAKPFRFGIVVAQWNAEVTGPLYNGAYSLLLEKGAEESNITTIEVPGSFELTSGADILLSSKNVDAVICLGCVIQGETRHFDFICSAVAHGITEVSVKHNKPVIFGVLTTDNLQQAKDRSGGRLGNKGDEAAATAIQMAALQASLQTTV